MTAFDWVLIVLGAAALVPSALRWLRVAQREHYIAGWVSRLAALWLTRRPINAWVSAAVVLLVTVSVVAVSLGQPVIAQGSALLAILTAAVLPLGLSVRGVSAPLNWTARLRRVAAGYGVLAVALSALLWWVVGAAGFAVVLVVAPLLMDAALVPLAAIEKRLSHKYLVSARKRLTQVLPTIVAITGSYGKTSTKGYVNHVLDGAFAQVASPASFNNLMGLSRAVNDRVVPGTEVFIAEMGVYGRGEIRELSQSFPPDIAAITTIGEAHLARMGSRAVIAAAKSEITEKARIVVLPIDEPELAALAERCRAEGKTVITVSTHAEVPADVVVDAASGTLTVVSESGTSASVTEVFPVTVPAVGHAVNIAITVGIARALGMAASAIAPRLANLPGAAHRAEIQVAESGVAIVDDTYNSNPVGAERAVRGAAELAASRGGRLVVVTPGMVELGHVQDERNRQLAETVAEVGGQLLAVGRTNRAALIAGSASAAHPTQVFDQRSVAVTAALKLADERGVILYENDLPDHYP